MIPLILIVLIFERILQQDYSVASDSSKGKFFGLFGHEAPVRNIHPSEVEEKSGSSS
jgi:hypothetical protein